MQRKIRVLVGKPGLDGHDRGAKVVAAALRDAGMEVIYTGLHQTPEQIVEAAVQEDVDVVALSVLSGAHMTLFPEILELMRSRGIGDRLLTGGGIIPTEDMNTLLTRGVGKLFGPGTNTHDIVGYIREWYADVHGADALPPLPPPPERAEPIVSAGERPLPAPPRPVHPARADTKPAGSRLAAKPAARRAKPAGPAPAKSGSAKRAKSGRAKPATAARKKTAASARPAVKRPARTGGARKKGARR
jgi:methylmalonyl-CoA mutase C-terminal domain/subunit